MQKQHLFPCLCFTGSEKEKQFKIPTAFALPLTTTVNILVSVSTFTEKHLHFFKSATLLPSYFFFKNPNHTTQPFLFPLVKWNKLTTL